MTYNEWRDELKSNLLGVDEAERKRVLDYYAEAYADRREAGFSEEQIIKEFGAPYDAAQRILNEEGKGEEKKPAPAPTPTPAPKPAPAEQTPVAQSIAPAPIEEKKEEKKGMKPIFIVLIALGGVAATVVSAVLIFVFLLFALNGFNLKAPEFELKTYMTTGDISKLEIDVGAASVKTEYYDGDKIIVIYPVSEQLYMNVTETNGTLKVEGMKHVKWYHTVLNAKNAQQTVIKIPSGSVMELDLDVGAGMVEIASGEFTACDVDVGAGEVVLGDVTCTTFEIDVGAGDVKIGKIACTAFESDVSAGAVRIGGVTANAFQCDVSAGSFTADNVSCPKLDLHVSAGAIAVGVNGKKAEYNINVNKSAGACNVREKDGTDPNKTVNIRISAGSVDVNFSE